MIENESNSLHHDNDYSNDHNPDDERKKITVYKNFYINDNHNDNLYYD
jgi:hypothetical protein